MTLLHLAWVCFVLALVPALMYLWNAFLFRRPRNREAASGLKMSVLIPARNEEASIAACVESVLASRGVELEAIVLDDHCDDRTAEIVRELEKRDPRVRLEVAPPLPEGWCGKQHACFVLSKLARHDILTFLDADVRLEPDALARMALFLEESQAALVSGFPRQATGTFLEKLLIPLINWLLLSFLPLWGMRHSRWAALGAGCGQWFMTIGEAYEKVGGHEAVKASMHDGLTLPRAYRRAGFHIDVCDATDLATCRMYRSASGVWNGLAKNAHEGMATPLALPSWTALLLCGQVLPFVLLAVWPQSMLLAAACLAYLPRLSCAVQFRQSWLGALLHPAGVALLVAIQWYAIWRLVIGRPIGWKGRTHSASPRPAVRGLSKVTRPAPRRSPGRLFP